MVEAQSSPAHGIVLWHAEHHNFVRLLDCLQAHADAIAAGETPNYSLMIDILTYLRRYPDRYHHPREDEAFARLRARDPAAAAEADALAREHRELANGGQHLLEHLEEALAE